MDRSIVFVISCSMFGGCVLDSELPTDDPASDSTPTSTTQSIESEPEFQTVTIDRRWFDGDLFAQDFYYPVGRYCSSGYERVDKPGDPVTQWEGGGYCAFYGWATPSDVNDCTAIIHAHTNGWWSGGNCTSTVHESSILRDIPSHYDAVNTSNATVNTADDEIVLGAGTRVVISTYAYYGDTFLVLSYPMTFPYYGTQAAANDDVAPGILGSRIDFTSPVSGTFTLHAGCYANTACGGTAAWNYVR